MKPISLISGWTRFQLRSLLVGLIFDRPKIFTAQVFRIEGQKRNFNSIEILVRFFFFFEKILVRYRHCSGLKSSGSLPLGSNCHTLSQTHSPVAETTKMAMPLKPFSSPSYSLRPNQHLLLSHNHSFSSLPTTTPFIAFSTYQVAVPRLALRSKIRCVNKEQVNPAPSIDPKAGVSVYKPKSYEVLVTDAANSLACALDDGKTRLEIDFP